MSNTRPIIIRTTRGEKTLPAEVKKKVAELTGGFIDDEKVSEVRSIEKELAHLVHYERRIDILMAGVEALIDSSTNPDVMTDKERIKNVFQRIKQDALAKLQAEAKKHEDQQKKEIATLTAKMNKLNEKKDFVAGEKIRQQIEKVKANLGPMEASQNILGLYIKDLKSALVKEAGISKKEVTKALSSAEEYATLMHGRSVLCTVTPIAGAGAFDTSEYMIQLETPQSPLSKQKQQEFLRLAQALTINLNPPDAPLWYRIMPDSEKKLFRYALNFPTPAQTAEDIAERVQAISSKHRTIPGLANFSRHTYVVMDEKGRVKVENSRLRSSMVSSRDIQKIEKQMTGWRARLKKPRAEIEKLKKEFAALRVEIAKDNIIQIIDTQTPFAIAEISKNTRLSNGMVVTVPVLMQTLITPANLAGPDSGLLNDKDAAIAELRKDKYNHFQPYKTPDGTIISIQYEIISTNHPLNYGRYLTPTGQLKDKESVKTGRNIEDVSRLILLLHERDRERDDDKLRAVADGLKKELEKSGRGEDREIYLAAMEELAVSLMNGVSYGSCVSGKDRKGMETIYADALHEYFTHYYDADVKAQNDAMRTTQAEWTPEAPGLPPSTSGANENDLQSQRRKEFVRLFTNAFITFHQHENAGQNSPGSEALKTAEFYLPKDIIESIKEATKNPAIHKQSDRHASNNEISTIKVTRMAKIKKYFFKRSRTAQAAEITPARSLIAEIKGILPLNPDKNMKRLYDAIKDNKSLKELGVLCEKLSQESMSNYSARNHNIYMLIQELAKDEMSILGIINLEEMKILTYIQKTLDQYPNNNSLKPIRDHMQAGLDSLQLLRTAVDFLKANNEMDDKGICNKIIALSEAHGELAKALHSNARNAGQNAFNAKVHQIKTGSDNVAPTSTAKQPRTLSMR